MDDIDKIFNDTNTPTPQRNNKSKKELSKLEQDYARSLLSSIKINNTNKNKDDLPFAYVDVNSNGTITWICNKDASGRIISVFKNSLDKENGKECFELDNIEKAKEMRDGLICMGWQKLKPPNAEFSYEGYEGVAYTNEETHLPEVKLNRRQRRKLAKEVKKELKKKI